METEYIKRNISNIYSKNTNFLFKFSSCNVHPVTYPIWRHSSKHPVLCRWDARMVQ